MKHSLALCLTVLAAPGLAESTRDLDAHEHGTGALNIAVEGQTVAMEFHAPGADIVGFEHAATSDADKAAIEAAVGTLSKPLDLFVLPEAAGCSTSEVHAALEGDEDHAQDEHDHEEHDHDAHAEEEKHDDHDHDHEDHAGDEAGHTEFHAEYVLNCTDPGAITAIEFAYFETFENALEVEVQILTASGATAFEVERAAPRLDLSGLF